MTWSDCLAARPIVMAVALSVPMAASAQVPEPRPADPALVVPKLDPTVVTGLNYPGSPLKELLAVIAKAGGISFRFHSAVSNLDAMSALSLGKVTVEDALRAVLDPKGLAFKATGPKAVFVYPDTPANRETYAESVRTFTIATADLAALMTTLNRLVTPGADELRPVMVSSRETRTISVRATRDMMARIAKVIADNDK